MTLKIRKINKKDKEIFNKFEKELAYFEGDLDKNITHPEKIEYNNFSKLINSNKSCCYLAIYNDNPIGYGVGIVKKNSSAFKDKNYGCIETIYIYKKYRKLGVGKKIFIKIKKWFISKGIGYIRLKGFSDNYGAIKSYEKWGFKYYINEMIYNI